MCEIMTTMCNASVSFVSDAKHISAEDFKCASHNVLVAIMCLDRKVSASCFLKTDVCKLFVLVRRILLVNM